MAIAKKPEVERGRGYARYVALAVGLMALLILVDLEAMDFDESGLMGLVVVLILLASLWLVLTGIFRRRLAMALNGIELFLLLVASSLISGLVQNEQVDESKRRGDLICQALSSYEERVGSYPDSLEDLVPSDLPQVPHTAMGVVRSFEYRYVRRRGGGYTLSFAVPAWVGYQRGPDGDWAWYD